MQNKISTNIIKKEIKLINKNLPHFSNMAYMAYMATL